MTQTFITNSASAKNACVYSDKDYTFPTLLLAIRSLLVTFCFKLLILEEMQTAEKFPSFQNNSVVIECIDLDTIPVCGRHNLSSVEHCSAYVTKQ
jgi:hypothetical protein